MRKLNFRRKNDEKTSPSSILSNSEQLNQPKSTMLTFAAWYFYPIFEDSQKT
jgi:hypothetical protein